MKSHILPLFLKLKLDFFTEEKQNVTSKSISESLSKLAGFSETFQKLLDLGVDLSHWERKGWTDFAITLDFEQNVKPVILFLKDHGVKVQDMGKSFDFQLYM